MTPVVQDCLLDSTDDLVGVCRGSDCNLRRVGIEDVTVGDVIENLKIDKEFCIFPLVEAPHSIQPIQLAMEVGVRDALVSCRL